MAGAHFVENIIFHWRSKVTKLQKGWKARGIPNIVEGLMVKESSRVFFSGDIVSETKCL
jgi:hypothetical protein